MTKISEAEIVKVFNDYLEREGTPPSITMLRKLTKSGFIRIKEIVEKYNLEPLQYVGGVSQDDFEKLFNDKFIKTGKRPSAKQMAEITKLSVSGCSKKIKLILIKENELRESKTQSVEIDTTDVYANEFTMRMLVQRHNSRRKSENKERCCLL